jgi:nicotinate dehydrogenase subunit A
MAERLNLKVNGRTQTLNVERDTPLLYALRNDLGLNGPKFGCGLAQCGACTVLLDGEPVRSCITPVSEVGARAVTTLESLGTVEKPHPVQRAFIAEQAAQCGYCMNGMIMATAALLAKNPKPSDSDIREALDGNLCRCGTHLRIIRAVRRAAQEMAS